MNNREKVKMANAAKTNLVGRKLFWFAERVEDESQPIAPEKYAELIELYLQRFDEELEQINIKRAINPKRQNNVSRESVIKITLEKDVNDFNGGGIELPNLCDPVEFKAFQDWDGDSSQIHNLKLMFISKKLLQKWQNQSNKML
jgi:translation machinery-associated protein 16